MVKLSSVLVARLIASAMLACEQSARTVADNPNSFEFDTDKGVLTITVTESTIEMSYSTGDAVSVTHEIVQILVNGAISLANDELMAACWKAPVNDEQRKAVSWLDRQQYDLNVGYQAH